MQKNNQIYSLTSKLILCLSIIFSSQGHALMPLSDSPLFLGANISPNVMFTLDDSGSMHFEIMPANLIRHGVRYMFPRAQNIYGAGDYSNRTVGVDANNSFAASLRSSRVNKIYYNPELTYIPWSNADRSLMSNADPTCAPHNPMNTAAGCRNLTVNNKQNASWLRSDGSLSSYQSGTFYPAVYFRYNGGNINSAKSYTKIAIISKAPKYTGSVNRLDCVAAPICTYQEEIQNFANWYTYYRSRILLSRAGVGRAFAAQGNTMRVGFASINRGKANIDGVETRVIINGVRQFTAANKSNFFNSLYGHTLPPAGTPLLRAVDEVGKYYQRDDDKGPWSDTPGSSGGEQLECRQNYNILMTDGFWNGSDIGTGNSDNKAGDSITNDSAVAVPPSYAYKPEPPYADDHSETLADVAMYYWKKDLRPDMLNKVPASLQNPAFWQHMSTYTVGLGVTGTLTELPSSTGGWPNPRNSDAAKIDDLWHAAVNGRGKFFSAADPEAFSNALSSSLLTIVARTGSASAVAANSSSLRTDGRLYQAKFDSGDWSGQLLSIPVDSQGNYGVAEWDAGDVSLAPDVIDHLKRVVITKGSTDGVSFEYANLTAAQKALLDRDSTGNVDSCGPERVAYLRGDSSSEGTDGMFNCAASSSAVNRFHSRTANKLGDIVNSSPSFVGVPNAGYSDVDHPGYAAFRKAYKDRVPMVYVGANDGLLHGFNACIPGVTLGCAAADAGKELISYIPSTVFGNLSRLTNKTYNDNHRYFVDGSPMVSDVDIGAATASWRTVLVGSLGGGGQGYFALDVTNPLDASQSAPVFTATNAADLLLWEFSKADDIDMGYSYSLPPIDMFSAQAKQMVKMENGKWAVVVGNGYNSDAGKAVLYILFVSGGVDGAWTPDIDYIKLVADAGTGNGLSTPMPFDSNGNGKADVIYAGDIKGNMWKFDVSDPSSSNWKVAIGGLPLFVSGTNKPIVSPPVVTNHPDGDSLVLFGTGKYLEVGDTTNTDKQSVYGIWDHNTSVTVTESDLVEQVLTGSDPRIGTQNLVTYSASVKGWYMGLPASGERVTGMPTLIDGIFVFNSIIPSVSTCDFGGSGFTYGINFLTGGMLPFAVFDINKNGIVSFNDGLSAGISTGFSPGGIRLVMAKTQNFGYQPTINGDLVKTPIAKGMSGLRGRITWRELVQ